MMEKSACVGLTVNNSSPIAQEKSLYFLKLNISVQGRNLTVCRNVPEAGSQKKNKPHYKLGIRGERPFFSNRELYIDSYCERENKNSNWDMDDDGKYDFVTAKCQLLVNPGTDITEVLKNPDTSVSWVDIADVRCFQTESTNCPICLYPPVAPRMGPCGHIYCLPCVWYFIDYENDILSKKCAVCNTFLRHSELKRVTLCPVNVPCVNQLCELVLMRRYRPVPFPTNFEDVAKAGESLLVSMEDLPISLFSRVSIASSSNLKKLVQRDISIMEKYIADSKLDAYNANMVPVAEHILFNLSTELDAYTSKNRRADSSKQFPVGVGDPDRSFMYYEDINGLDIYLHSTNWRCLTLEYNNKKLPECISGQVVEVECHTVTHEFRRRYRYLSHLPIGRSVFFVELDLQPPIVSVETLKAMSEVIVARHKRREHRLQIEKSLTRAKEEAENRIQSLPLGSRLIGHVDLNVVPTDADFVPLSAASSTITTSSPLPRSFASVSQIGAVNVVDRHRVAKFLCPGERAQYFETAAESWPSLGTSIPQATSSSNWAMADSVSTSSPHTVDVDPPLPEASALTTSVSVTKRRSRRHKTAPKSMPNLVSLSLTDLPP